MTNSIAETTIRTLFHIRIEQKGRKRAVVLGDRNKTKMTASHTRETREEKRFIK